MSTTTPVPGAGSTPSQGLAGGRLSGRDFFRLLLTQLRSQNPLEPLDNADFLAQLAQFSTLDQMDILNSRVNLLARMEGLSAAGALIGRAVEFLDPATGRRDSGVVSAVTLEDGVVHLDVGGRRIPISHIVGIQAGPGPGSGSGPALRARDQGGA